MYIYICTYVYIHKYMFVYIYTYFTSDLLIFLLPPPCFHSVCLLQIGTVFVLVIASSVPNYWNSTKLQSLNDLFACFFVNSVISLFFQVCMLQNWCSVLSCDRELNSKLRITYIHVHIHIHVFMYIYTYKYIYIYTYTYTCIVMHMYTCILHVYAYVYVYA